MRIRSARPLPGMVLFTSHPGPMGMGIRWATRRGAGPIRVTHAGLIGSGDETIESHFPQGVHVGSFEQLMATIQPGKHRRLFLGVPKGWTEMLGEEIVERAKDDIGKGYDLRSIVALGATSTIVGNIFNKITFGGSEWLLGNALNGRDDWFCSEHVAKVVSEILPEFDAGISAQAHFVTPQDLFDNPAIWDLAPANWEWKPERQEAA